MRRNHLINYIPKIYYASIILFLTQNIYSVSLVNKGGFDKYKEDEKIFIWSSISDEIYEAGFFNYGNWVQLYGGIYYINEKIELQAGSINKSIFNGFILSHGEYIPDDISTPDKKPIGYSIRIKKPYFQFFSGSFFKLASEKNNINSNSNIFSIEDKQNIHILSAALNYQISKIILESGSVISTTNKMKLENYNQFNNDLASFDPAVFFNVKFINLLEFQSLYSKKYGWFIFGEYNVKNIKMDLYLMSVKGVNPFSSLLYTEKRDYYFSLQNSNLKVKIYNQEKTVHLKSTIKVKNYGMYGYLNDDKNLIGFFYQSERNGLSPYFSIYLTPGIDVVNVSFGINFNKEWMFAIVNSTNKSLKYYPYDEQIVPDRFYYSGVTLDSQIGMNHSYFGFLFYWNQESFFCYTSLLQNYSEKGDDNLDLTIRIEYSKIF